MATLDATRLALALPFCVILGNVCALLTTLAVLLIGAPFAVPALT